MIGNTLLSEVSAKWGSVVPIFVVCHPTRVIAAPLYGEATASVSYLTDGFVGCLPLGEGDKSVAPADKFVSLIAVTNIQLPGYLIWHKIDTEVLYRVTIQVD